MTLRDSDVPAVLNETLDFESLVVALNHKSSSVRAELVRLLAACFSRSPSEIQLQFLRKKGFHLIGNQLHQRPTTQPIAEACLYFLLGQSLAVDETLNLPYDNAADSEFAAQDRYSNHAVVILLAILERSLDYGSDLCCHLLSRLVSFTSQVLTVFHSF